MIFKKKKKNYFKKFLNIFKNISLVLIVLQILLIMSLFSYYHTSALSQKIPFERVKNKIFKVIGFDYSHLKNLPEIYSAILSSYLKKNDLETIDISLDQRSLINLDIQRKNRLDGSDYESWKYVNGELNYKNDNFKIKVRPRGARQLHYVNFNEMSLRVDMKGSDYFLGMEEFNLHKPLLRNYIHEWIFHKILNENEIFSPNYNFINLNINGSSRGIFAIEETFSKELIERNNKRFGPVFEFDSKVGAFKESPALISVYNKNFWNRSEYNKEILSQSTLILENFLKDDKIFDKYVDIKKWAKFFAIADLTRSYHGTVKHSVRYFFNPVTSKIEPIPFDGHIGTGDFESFYLLDFLKEETKGCYWICYDKPFFQKFFRRIDGTLRSDFIETYLTTLKKISKSEYLDDFFNQHNDYIKMMNSLFYRENSKKDLIFYKSISRYFFDTSFYYSRSKEIRNRLKSQSLKDPYKIIYSGTENNYKFINRKNGIPVFLKSINCKDANQKFLDYIVNKYYYFDEILRLKNDLNCRYATFVDLENNDKIIEIDIYKKKSINQKFFLDNYVKISNEKIIDKSLILKGDLYFDQNSKLVIKDNVKINLNGYNILINGEFFFNGKLDKNIEIEGPGSLIFNYAEGEIENAKFKNLTLPNLFGYTLYSGINFLNSNISLKNIEISNISTEDAVNFVSSNVKIDNIFFSNIEFDALDSDFSNLDFKKIECFNVKNDCLDTSSSIVNGIQILANKIGDKALSLGEQSEVNIKDVEIDNSHLGLAAKDGSKVKIESIILNDLKFDIAIYKKKSFFLRDTIVEINNIVSQKDKKSYQIYKDKFSYLKIKNKISLKAKVMSSDKIFDIVTK
ncbi:hypothetical protein N8937_03200 [Candidatus Pelagibacter ubique]|nr:hypothetical protein [Candidatus Pelagibacter ubique]